MLSKENYISQYSLKDRCLNGDLKNVHMISTSSGTTGKPHYWPRNLQTEVDGALLHEYILTGIFKINKCKTLFLNGFALGNWIAGTYTSACLNLLAYKGLPVVVMSPGYDLKEILTTINDLSKYFEQTIIAGHTPFLKEIIEVAKKQAIGLKKLNIKLLGTGQGITENWRDYLIRGLSSKDNFSIINLFGSADAALMGFETAYTITLRKILNQQCAVESENIS